ncbi:hypothetical protein C7T35_32860 [Variovorax sp. WS11]|nr:hypothetical protein C7T35_32860 [Variovorax sp. WS11]
MQMAGYAIGGAVFFACIVSALIGGEDRTFQVMLCLLGGSVGWAAGIVATPLSEDEKSKFSGIAKAFVALGSGYVIGKIEGQLVTLVSGLIASNTATLAFRVVLFLTCTTIGFLFTLVTRLYGTTEQEKRKKHEARLLGQAEEILEKIQKARKA